MAYLPINPSILEWSMKDAALTVADLSEITARPAVTAGSWLNGSLQPQKGDVQKIAAAVGRSLQFFFLRQPPTDSSVAASFRAALGGQSETPAAELKAIRLATNLQKIARFAAEERDLKPVEFPSVLQDPAEYAAAVRKSLQWTVAEQISATSKTAVFKLLRGRIEHLGVVVVYRSMGAGNCRGFSLSDPIAPLIGINSEYRLPTLRSWTLLHEFAHLARGSQAVCHDEDTKEERWCDSFAAAFLMPRGDVLGYFRYHDWQGVTVAQIQERVRLTSNRFKASWQSVAIRLRDLGLAEQAVVDRVFETSGEWDEPGGWAQPGTRTTPVIRVEEYGATLTRAVLELRELERLSELDARRYLNVDGRELGLMRQLVTGTS